MKSFIIQLLIFVSPLILGAIVMEVILRKIPNDYTYKYNYLTANGGEIETLILGSSHAVYGVYPDSFSSSAFNAAHVSQTFHYDYVVLSQVMESLPNLKHLIIPVSYFSFRTSLDQSAESWRIKNYHLYYDCDSCDQRWEHRLEIVNGTFSANLRRAWNWVRNKQDEVHSDRLGYGTKYLNKPSKDLAKTAAVAAQRHTHPSQELVKENQEDLDRMIQIARENGIEVVLLTMPGSTYYVELLEENQLAEMQAICLELATETNVSYVNLLEHSSFKDEDFRDGDHLTLQGAVKVSQYLDDLITQ